MATERWPSDGPGPPPAGGYRLVILGGGPAGIAAAREAARRGASVALVLPAADHAEPVQPTPLREQIRRVQARLGQAMPMEPPDEPGIDTVVGQAVFAGRHAVAVGGREIRFRRALVATGAWPTPGAVEGADQADCLRFETLGRLAELPRRLAVIGCGPVACVWAQAFRRFGSQVQLIGRDRTVLPDEGPDAAGRVQARLEQEDIRLYLGCQEVAIERTGSLPSVVVGQDGQREKLLVDRVLLCGPWQPKCAGLGLESAGVAYSDRGIVVGDRLQTTNRHIFAAGGACGAELASPHAAEATARLAVHNALGWIPRRFSRLAIPRCIDTSPMVAAVGLMPRDRGGDQRRFDSYRVELAEADASMAAGHREGLILVHVRAGTGRILGATVIAEGADDLIAPLVLLMTRRWPLAALADVTACRFSRFELLARLGQRCKQARRARLGAGIVDRWRARRQPGKRT